MTKMVWVCLNGCEHFWIIPFISVSSPFWGEGGREQGGGRIFNWMLAHVNDPIHSFIPFGGGVAGLGEGAGFLIGCELICY